MDRQTAEHFYRWLESSVPEDEQPAVEQAIHKLLRDYPELVLTHSWLQMRDLSGYRFGD